MMPIKIEPFFAPIYVEDEDDVIGKDYKIYKFYNFFPEFLEEVYTGTNKDKLADANKILLDFLEERNKGNFEYIASWKKKQKGETLLCEYYGNGEGNIIGFLIIIPIGKSKYYPRLESVAIFTQSSGEDEEVV